MMSMEDRYMVMMVERCQFTPTEMREAAMLAAIIYDRQRARLTFIVPRGGG